MTAAAAFRGVAMKWNDRIGRRLKLHDLHVLLTVAELGSMGKAAERLAVSQPSVSKAIADMERAIGVRLLDRTAKGVETTAYGRALLRRGLGAFEELRQGIKDIENLADPTTGEVRIGSPEAIACGLLTAVIDRFSQKHPRVVVTVTSANNVSQEFRLLRDRTVDCLIGALPAPFSEADLDAEVLYQDWARILAGSRHPLARRRDRSCRTRRPAMAAAAREHLHLSPGCSVRGAWADVPEDGRAILFRSPARKPARNQPLRLGGIRLRAPLQCRSLLAQGPS